MKGPRIAYLTLWTLVNGRTMLAITSQKSFEDWQKSPEEYAEKRIRRFNAKKGNRFLQPQTRASAFRVEKYVREDVHATANIAEVVSVEPKVFRIQFPEAKR